MMVPRIPERLPVDVPEVTSSSCLIPEVHTRDGSGKGSGTVHVVSVPNGTDGPGWPYVVDTDVFGPGNTQK